MRHLDGFARLHRLNVCTSRLNKYQNDNTLWLSTLTRTWAINAYTQLKMRAIARYFTYYIIYDRAQHHQAATLPAGQSNFATGIILGVDVLQIRIREYARSMLFTSHGIENAAAVRDEIAHAARTSKRAGRRTAAVSTQQLRKLCVTR